MKLPILSSRRLCRFLEKEGFKAIRQRGSHRYFKHVDGRVTVVPIHSGKKIKRGLLGAILEQIKMKRNEFMKKIRKHL